MSKKLYYSSCSFDAPNTGVTIDDILLSKKSGDEVYWAYCRCALSSCTTNLNGHNSICNFCHMMYRKYTRKYGKGVHLIPIEKDKFEHKSHVWNLDSVQQIKSIIYRDVYVGTSILSLYFSATRDLDIKKREEFKRFALPLINEICDFVDYTYDLINRIQPDEIISYNGRLYENRLFYDIANSLGIKYTALEIVGGGGVEPYKKVRFEGGLPHSVKLNTQKIESLWQNSPLSDDKKAEIASSFYTRRRGGELVADVAVYITAQKEGTLPPGFDPKQRNIAIFNSSQDEMAALGGEWETGYAFSTQYDAIEYMLQNTSDIHYYLRIHPNLKGIDHQDHMKLYELSKYENITIIPPESEVSTYALMEACEKVVTFGSTMGVEATFWGKPSLLMGRALYENLDVCYNVYDKKQLLPLLLDSSLKPKNKIGALKYAYFELDREYGVEKNVINIDVKYIKKHWLFRQTSYFKILGSKFLYQVVYFIYCIVAPKFSKGRTQFPM